MIRDLDVSNNRLIVVIGNDGEGELPAGQEIGISVRGVSVTVELPEDLTEGGSSSFLIEDQVLYYAVVVLAVVDPDDLIREEDDNNNALGKDLVPDAPFDLAIAGLGAAGGNQHLAVDIRNNSQSPIPDVTVKITVFRLGYSTPASIKKYDLSMDALETVRVEVFDVAGVSGFSFRVEMEVLTLADANPSNNVFEGGV